MVESLDEPLARVLAGEAAERVLDRALRKGRWSAPGRTAAAEALFGVGLWRRTLRVLLGDPDATPRDLLFALVHVLAGRAADEAATLCGLSAPPRIVERPSSFADRWSLPDWLADHLVEIAGDEAEALAQALASPGPIFLRTNTLLTSREALQARLADEGVATRGTRHSALGLEVIGARPNIFGLAAHQAGHFEVQDEGGQLLGALVEARAQERVLDLCAGAGGKTLQLAAQMENSGVLDAYDLDAGRLERLHVRAQRAGVKNVRVIHRVPDNAEDFYDRVLIDAPCSELGTLRRGPDLRWRLTPEVLTQHVPVQRALLAAAATVLRSGGTLVYATCTFNPRENEDVVREFLSTNREFVLVRPGFAAPLVDDSGFFRCWPHRDGTDAFFAAVLRRAG